MKVGSLVGYVQFNAKDFNMIQPQKEKIYTVREFFPKGSIAAQTSHGIVYSSEDGIWLEEIVNEPKVYGIAQIKFEDAYCASSFREIQPPIANIEEHIYQNTLTPELI